MRSRDGNHSFSLTVPVLAFFFCSLALHASEYLISYRYSVHNAILYNEALHVSKSMQKCSGTPKESILFESSGDETLKAIIAKNEEEFIEFIHKIGLTLTHNEEHNTHKNLSTTILTLRTRCFKVDFNDTFVKISALKQP